MIPEKLNDIQKRIFALPTNNSFVVLGTAGSGKTTLAMLRGAHLSNLDTNPKVLIVAFNRTLISYMKRISQGNPSNLTIETYHKFARGYLSSRKLMGNDVIIKAQEKAEIISLVVKELHTEYPTESTFNRPIKFFINEINFIQQFGFGSFDEYHQAVRIGRGEEYITRTNRKWMYKVFEGYKEIRAQRGKKYDWDDLAYHVHQQLLVDNTERRYTHIIIDEGQDFSPMMVKSLVLAKRQGGSFCFFGDVAQQIYGSRLSWKDSGIDLYKQWILSRNYRNPITITRFAIDLTENEYWQSDEDMIQPENEIAEGPKPVLMKFSDEASELTWCLKKACEYAENTAVAVVCRTNYDANSLLKYFASNNCWATRLREDQGDIIGRGIYITTYHSSKGLEFDYVFLPFLTAQKIPDLTAVQQGVSEQEVIGDELKLLYVAITRSKYGLYMTFTGELTSLFPIKSLNVDKYQHPLNVSF